MFAKNPAQATCAGFFVGLGGQSNTETDTAWTNRITVSQFLRYSPKKTLAKFVFIVHPHNLTQN
jgi:hypothetical protein